MTERTRLWRWVDLLALTGLLVLLVGLPASGSDGANGQPYAQATTFEIPWPRVGDHIVYDLVVDDGNGLRTYEALMEVERRLAVPGEVPVDAPFVEERTFRPMHDTRDHFVLDSRGWMDRTYYLASGERAYVVAEGIRPAFDNETDYRDEVEWVEIQWEGQIPAREVGTTHWYEMGATVAHRPDDRSALNALIQNTLNEPKTPYIPTIAEAEYHGEDLYAFGFGSDRLHMERTVNAIFPSEHAEECAMHLGHWYWPFGSLPLLAYWDDRTKECFQDDGYWVQPDHAGLAGAHWERQWEDGRTITMDLLPRLLERGDGPEYRPLSRWIDLEQDTVSRVERNARPPATVSARDIELDPRPIVRNLTLPALRHAFIANGPECVRDFLLDGGRIVSFGWYHQWNHTLLDRTPQTPVSYPDIPILPGGHDPGDTTATYLSSWDLAFADANGLVMTASPAVEETYPGPTIAFSGWSEGDGGTCTEEGRMVDPDVRVVPPAELAADAANRVIDYLELPPSHHDTALTVFAFDPAFEWESTSETHPVGIGWLSGRNSVMPNAVGKDMPWYDSALGVAKFTHITPGYYHPIAGAISAHDGELVHESRWHYSGESPSPDASLAVRGDAVQYRDAAPWGRDAGFALLGTWLVVRIALAIRVGAHFPVVAWLYAKIQDSDVLLHERRSAIIAVLRHDPGMTASDVSKRLGLAWGATVHHLDRLSQAGLVRGVRDGRRRRFVVVEDGVGAKEALAASPERARLVAALAEEPGLSATELATRLSRDRTSVARLAAQLVELDLLERRRDGRKVRFYPKTLDH